MECEVHALLLFLIECHVRHSLTFPERFLLALLHTHITPVAPIKYHSFSFEIDHLKLNLLLRIQYQ